jgi:hypothetical protein
MIVSLLCRYSGFGTVPFTVMAVIAPLPPVFRVQFHIWIRKMVESRFFSWGGSVLQSYGGGGGGIKA